MVALADIHSLTDFQRNVRTHLSRMKKTGRPLVLTVNGKAELVVQDARSYEKMMNLLDRAEAIAAIQEGLDDAAKGRTQPVDRAFRAIRRKARSA